MEENPKVERTIDIRHLMAIAWRRKWLMILPVIVAGAVAYGLSYMMTPMYESSTIIQIDPQVHLIDELQRLIGGDGRAGTRAADRNSMGQSIYNELTSTHFATLLSQRMTLAGRPEIEQKAQVYMQSLPSITPEQARLIALQDKIRESVELRWASGDQICIYVTSADPREARDIANNLGEIFIEERIKQDMSEIRSSQDFSDVQLVRYERQLNAKTQEMSRVEQQLSDLRMRETTSSNQANRSELVAEIDQTETDIGDLRREERVILDRLGNTPDLNTAQLTLEDSEEKANNQSELKRRIAQIGDLLSGRTWSDPQVLNFRVRQNELLLDIENENRRLVDAQYSQFDADVRRDLASLFNIRANLDYLYSKKPYLESALRDLSSDTSLIPELEARLAQLQREVEVARDIKDRFRRQLESSTISQAFLEERSTSKYRQVEPAKVSPYPFEPNRKRIVLMGIMLGIAIGGGVVMLMELLDNSLKKVEDVEEFLGLPVLGIAPKADFMKSVRS